MLAEFVSFFAIRGPVRLEFRQMIHAPIYLAEDRPEQEGRVGKLSFGSGAEARSYGIYTDASHSIDGHVECNEKAVIAAAQFSGDRAVGEIGKPGNFIDTIVALNKALVAGHVDGTKKIIFSSVALDVVPHVGKMRVELTKKLGTKIFVSDIYWDDHKIGSLTFMTV